MTLTVALAQMRVEPGRVARNLETARAMVALAAAEGADIVLLPECLDTGWGVLLLWTKPEPFQAGEASRR